MSLERKMKGAIMPAIALLATAAIGVGSIHKTDSTEVGVRVNKITGEVVAEEYQPGAMHFFPPLINDWYKFDTKLVNIEMTARPDEGDREGRDDLKFKTKDGNDIELDIIITYRIDPTKADYIVQHVAKSDEQLKDKIVRAVSRSTTRNPFGELTTEEFYQAVNRNEAAEKAKGALNDLLNDYGVIVERVESKDYRWGNQDYAQAITDKVVAEQNTLELAAKYSAQVEDNRKKLNDAVAQYNKTKQEADGQFERAKLDADAYVQLKQDEAQAILVEGSNEAEAITKTREAMLSQGGRTLVQMAIAENLQGTPIYMVPMGGSGNSLGIQTLDINGILETYGIMGLSGKSIPGQTDSQYRSGN